MPGSSDNVRPSGDLVRDVLYPYDIKASSVRRNISGSCYTAEAAGGSSVGPFKVCIDSLGVYCESDTQLIHIYTGVLH